MERIQRSRTTALYLFFSTIAEQGEQGREVRITQINRDTEKKPITTIYI
jgi:hypothetical protein